MRIVGDARHIKNVPGRETDVNNTKWTVELVCRGLIQLNSVPSK